MTEVDVSLQDREWPDVAIPPGELLAEELAARGMSQSELARRMGRPVQAINQIIRGLKTITPETAFQLEEVLGTDAYTWIRLESDYRFNVARLARKPRRRSPAVAVRRRAVPRETSRRRAAVESTAAPRRKPARRG